MPAIRRTNPLLDEFPGAEPFLPPRHSLVALRAAVQACRGCPLFHGTTQAVFGEGPKSSHVMLIGEQPGDAEDRSGRPFVGPAGRLLDDALAFADIPRDEVYVTNAVKHFKHTLRGKRRIHARPTRYEIEACRPWLRSELEELRPEIVVLLGATAAQALFGAQFRVTKSRGVALENQLARWTFATVHPSSVLRARGDEARREARERFFEDIAVVGEYFRKL
jgi:uracil-DNA glycosylase family protein